MQIILNVSKKHVYVLSSAAVVLTIAILVKAYGGSYSQPSVMNNTFNELEPGPFNSGSHTLPSGSKIGVGMSPVNNVFEVAGKETFSDGVLLGGSNGWTPLFMDGGARHWMFTAHNEDNFYLRRHNGAGYDEFPLTVEPSGKIGVHKTSLASTMDVGGNIQTDGTIYESGGADCIGGGRLDYTDQQIISLAGGGYVDCPDGYVATGFDWYGSADEHIRYIRCTKIGGSVSNPVGGSIGGSEICVGSDCFVVEFANLGEDSSEPARRGPDTCNGTQNRYECPPDVERTCLDRYTGEHQGDWGGPPTVYKTVTCAINKRLVYKMP